MNYLNNERLNAVIAMPVETMALLSDDKDIIDKDYKDFTAEMYAKGHSFFTYISDNPNSLSSCCRLRNEITENTFSFTNGLTGIQTGSVNVITLNLSRIVQDWYKDFCNNATDGYTSEGKAEPISLLNTAKGYWYESLQNYLINILDRVYKYHIAYKTMMYDIEDKGMLTSSKAGYIFMKKLYSTIGLNGINEAAEFLGIECSYNEHYMNFCNLITSTIKEQNQLHNIKDNKRPFLFNSEFVPAESLSSKNYNWDKEEGYWIPSNRNLYNSYFYLADNDTSVLDKFRLHGRDFTSTLDGGVGCHINLQEHLSKKQYLKLLEFAVKEGTSYFTFNIPNSECEDCHYIVKSPISECPKCHSTNIKWYTRIIGYLRAIKNFGKERQIEASRRTYHGSEIC
jgi:ribonucleoside-triphosphate reductase